MSVGRTVGTTDRMKLKRSEVAVIFSVMIYIPNYVKSFKNYLGHAHLHVDIISEIIFIGPLAVFYLA